MLSSAGAQPAHPPDRRRVARPGHPRAAAGRRDASPRSWSTARSEVWVERHGNLHRIDARFTNEAELMQTIDRIVSTVNRRVDESSPMVDARLPSGERVNVIIPPLSLVGPVLSIRRFPRAFTFEQLVRHGHRRSRHCRPAARARARAHVDRRLGRHRLRARRRCSTRCPGSSRPRSGSSPSRTPPSCSCSSRTSSRWRPARPTSRARARSPSATWCATRCACAPTASSSARSAAGDPRHAPGDEHRPRRLADHRARQLDRGLGRAACRRWPR